MKKIITLMVGIVLAFSLNAQTYTISQDGINFIKSYEKCKLTAYPDSGGWSIGYGHHGKDVHQGMKISKARAEKLFKEDIQKFEGSVRRLINSLPYEYEFSQGFIDGLYSLVYNCGEGGVKKSVFYQRLLKCRVSNGVMNKSDFNYTVAGVKQSRIYAKGHVQRRYDEHLMMLK